MPTALRIAFDAAPRLACWIALALAIGAVPAAAQERLPWEKAPSDSYGSVQRRDLPDPYEVRPAPPAGYGSQAQSGYGGSARANDAYRPSDPYGPPGAGSSRGGHPSDAYRPGPGQGQSYGGEYGASRPSPPVYDEPDPGRSDRYAAPYEGDERRRYGDPRRDDRPPYDQRYDDGGSEQSYSQNEVLGAGHRFFGQVSQGLASAVEYVFQQAGRPNGYILGEDAGGAFVAGLRYGEGVLYTKYAGQHRVYWQGPTLGYDFGAEGSKTMVLVYNLRDPADIYHRFAGVQGSAYLVGGVSVQFQKHGDVVLAPIRSGVGLRLGANVGYLKYTRRPTWNPF